MGAKPAKLGTLDVLLIPGTVLIVNQSNPTGGTVGSTVHHVGITVPDLKALLQGPDEIRIELSLGAWYLQTFNAVSGKCGEFEAADLPGVNLLFSAATPALVGTKGRSLDHIGFEVRDLEASTKKLEATGVHFAVPYRKIPARGISIAFSTDPWGTYIELTEGLAAA